MWYNEAIIRSGEYKPNCPNGKCDLKSGTVLAIDDTLSVDFNNGGDYNYAIQNNLSGNASGYTTDARAIDEYWCHGNNYVHGGAFFISQKNNTTKFYAKSPFNNPEELPYSQYHLQNVSMDVFNDRCDYTPETGITIPISDGSGSGHVWQKPSHSNQMPPVNKNCKTIPRVNTVTIN